MLARRGLHRYFCGMRRSARTFLRCGVAACVGIASFAGSARAATTIGSVSEAYAGSSEVGTPRVISQGGLEAVAPSSGVITSVSTRISAGTATVAFLRGSNASGPTVVGAVPVAGAAGSPVVTRPARFRVQFADRLAIGLNGTAQVRFAGVVGGGSITLFDQALPAVGGALTPGGTTVGSTELALSAVLEPDADADGYGDESQDSCPAVPTVHAGLCVADLRVTPSSEATTTTGSPALLSASLGNLSGAPARGATVRVTVPAGVELVALTVTGGSCTGASCTLGSLVGAESARVFAILRPTQEGAFPITFTLGTTDPVGNPSDDAGTVLLRATAPAPAAVGSATGGPGASGGSGPSAAGGSPLAGAVQLCVVPRLRGLTRAAAATKLGAAGCRLGKVTGPAGRRAKVRSQAIPAGIQVVAGTKIAVRVR